MEIPKSWTSDEESDWKSSTEFVRVHEAVRTKTTVSEMRVSVYCGNNDPPDRFETDIFQLKKLLRTNKKLVRFHILFDRIHSTHSADLDTIDVLQTLFGDRFHPYTLKKIGVSCAGGFDLTQPFLSLSYLASSVAYNPSLETLRLNNLCIHCSAADEFVSALLSNKVLKHLELSNVTFLSSIEPLCDAIAAHPRISTVDLYGRTESYDYFVHQMCKSLLSKNKPLENLRIVSICRGSSPKCYDLLSEFLTTPLCGCKCLSLEVCSLDFCSGPS